MQNGTWPNGLVEPEIAWLRRVAGELAERRGDDVSTSHLLAAILMRSGAASDLLRERKLFAEEVLRQASSVIQEDAEAFLGAFERARGIAQRMGATHASPEHVLIALLNERRSNARQIIEQLGCDVGRLRTVAMSLGQGLVTRRLQPAEDVQSRALATTEPTRGPDPTPGPKGIAIPIIPSGPERRASAKASRLAPAPDAQPSNPVPEKAADGHARTPVPFGAAELDARDFEALLGVGQNLSLRAARGELDPVVGREQEMDAVLDVLAKRHANNPCLVGPPGVGKTSIARGVAARLRGASGQDGGQVLVEIPVGDLLAGTGVRGALAARFAAIHEEVRRSKGRVVLFFDEMDRLLSGDAADEIAGDLRQALAQGTLPCIGATTEEAFARTLGRDPALSRCFTPIRVEEPSREETYLILEAAKPSLQAHHRLVYTKEALALSVAWSVRYLAGRALPEKALSVIDAAGARVQRRGGNEVKPEHVAEVVSSLTDVPVERLIETDGERMLRLEQLLAERVVGHAEHLKRIARILRRGAAGFSSTRPIGTFLLLGPTGVGKTETAKAIAEVLFHDERAMTRLDLSEFSESHAVARLIGAPPGYVGHEAGGQLTEAVRQRPYQVILLDELEKAHPDVLTLFLGVFDEGRLTDGRGRTVDFSNTVILMTSNLGSAGLAQAQKRRLGFGQSDETNVEDADVERQVAAAARGALAPELYNRIDEVLVFLPLKREEVREIARRMLASVERRLAEKHGIRLDTDTSVLEHLLDAGGFDARLGARPMKRTIARLFEAPLAERILAGEVRQGDLVLVHAEGGELHVDVLDAERASRLAGHAAE